MKWFSFILLVLSAIGGYVAYQHGYLSPKATVNPASDPGIVTAKVTRKDLDQLVHGRGEIKAPLTTEVKSEVNGLVTRVAVNPGDSVKKGDLLVELDKAELQSQINEASHQIEASKLSAEKTNLNLGREQQLMDAKLVSQKEYDEARIDSQLALNQLDIDTAKLETLKQQIAKTTILSPRDGTVLKVDVLEGNVIIGAGSVSSGTSLMTVADLNQLEVDADMDEIDVAKLGVGMPVALTLDSIPDLKIEGKIKFISPLAIAQETDKSIHVFPIIVSLTTTDKRIKVGLTANLAVPVAHAGKALSLPISMVYEDEKGSYVYVRTLPLGVARKDVKTGISDDISIEITSGLNEGDVVTLNPSQDKPAKSG